MAIYLKLQLEHLLGVGVIQKLALQHGFLRNLNVFRNLLE